MDSVVKVRECQWCHEPFYLSDGRYKYCSDECAEKSLRAQCKKNRRKTEETSKQSAWELYRDEIWRARLSAPCTRKKRKKRRRYCRARVV